MKINREMNKSIIEIFDANSDKIEATHIFNKKWNTSFGIRALNERYKNYKIGFEDGIFESATEDQIERLAKTKNKILIERKINLIQKKDLNELVTNVSVTKAAVEQIRESLSEYRKPKKLSNIIKESNKDFLLEFAIADFHFSGLKEDYEQIVKIESHIIDHIRKSKGKHSIVRISFLGDDITGTAGHMSQLLAAKDGMLKQATTVAQLYADMINEIKKYTEFLEVVFVSRSNHGMFGGRGKARYQFPEEDMGLIIAELLKYKLDNTIELITNESGIIETDDTIYLHGHQGFAKNKLRLFAELGLEKNIMIGHFHHLKVTQERNKFLIVCPTSKSGRENYEKDAGYNTSPMILKLMKQGKDIVGFQPIIIK